MATISVYLDRRTTGQNDAPVKAVIIHNRKSAMISLGVKVPPSMWDEETKSVKAGHPNHRYLNTFILGKKFAIEAELLKLETLGKMDVSISEIKGAIEAALNPDKKKSREHEKTFLFRYERFMGLKTRRNTINGYRWTLNKLKEFDPNLHKRRFEDITVDYINDFNAHFKDSSVNTRNVSMRYIRAVFRDAIKAGVTTAYPFSQISLKGQRTRKKALSPEQMRTLINCECRGMQGEYRDMFVLMFLLRGVNIGDLLHADKRLVRCEVCDPLSRGDRAGIDDVAVLERTGRNEQVHDLAAIPLERIDAHLLGLRLDMLSVKQARCAGCERAERRAHQPHPPPHRPIPSTLLLLETILREVPVDNPIVLEGAFGKRAVSVHGVCGFQRMPSSAKRIEGFCAGTEIGRFPHRRR